MPKRPSQVFEPSTTSTENRGHFSPASDNEVQIADALPAKSAHVQGKAMSGVHNVGCQGLFSPAPEESVDIQGPFSQASTCASEKSSPSSIITPPRPSPTPAGSVDFRETSSTASTGVEEASPSPSLLRVLPDSFTVTHEDIRVKMDSIFEEFCKTGDIRWINGDLLEHWLSVLEGVWRSSGSEDRFLEIPSSNTKYLLRHTYLEIYAVLEALWRGDSGR